MLTLTDFHIHSASNVLQNRKATLLEADGGVQKVRSVIRALLRMDKDKIEPNQLTEDTKPSDVLKYIADQIESAQKHEERPEQIEKVIKRLKKLVRNDNVSIEQVLLQFLLDGS
jgi:methionine salvage enolase-phosphatase E1